MFLRKEQRSSVIQELKLEFLVAYFFDFFRRLTSFAKNKHRIDELGTKMSKSRIKTRLTKRVIDAAQPESKVYFIWDSDLSGFGLRVQPSGTKSYVAFYRIGTGRGAKQPQVAIGKSNTITCDAARKEAQIYLANARIGDDHR